MNPLAKYFSIEMGLLGLLAAAGTAGYYMYSALSQQNEHDTVPTEHKMTTLHDLTSDPHDRTALIDEPSIMTKDELHKLVTQFNLASTFMRSKHGKTLRLSPDQQLRLYALYKTATYGPNDTPKPSILAFERVAMWNAWHELNGTSKREAMISYIELLYAWAPDWTNMITSKAMRSVLGENELADMMPDTDSDDDDDDDNDIGDDEHLSIDEMNNKLEIEITQLIQNEKNDERQRLMALYTHTPSSSSSSSSTAAGAAGAGAGAGVGAGAAGATQDSNTNTEKSQHDISSTIPSDVNTIDTIDTVLVTDDNDNNNNNNNNNTTDKANETSEEGDHTPYQRTLIHVCDTDFSDLVGLHDVGIFNQYILDENHKAVEQYNMKYKDKYAPYHIFNDQIILIDRNHVPLLHQVAENGTVQQASILVGTYNYPVNLLNSTGGTPLFVSIGAESVELAKAFIQLKADVNISDKQGTNIEMLISMVEDDNKRDQFIELLL